LENKWVFRRLQKTGKVCADVEMCAMTLLNVDGRR